MTTSEFTQPAATVKRDRYGRPMVIPPNGGKPIPYRRCTSFIDVLDSRYALEKWQQRQVATGIAARHDLVLKASSAAGDKKTLNDVCVAAQEAAGSSAAATSGTALHKITEQVDLGQDPLIPPSAQADIDAYQAATSHLTMAMVEVFVVHDDLQVGGTFDRVVEHNGQLYVADIKAGRIDYGSSKIAMQLATYSRGLLYHPDSGQREPLEVDTSRGLVIHLPTGAGECTLHWADLDAGWEGVHIAAQVWGWRGRQGLLDAHPPDAGAELMALIGMCADRASLESLWQTYSDIWREGHTAAAKAQLEGIETPLDPAGDPPMDPAEAA